jgi:hypothetical protein
MNSPVKGSVHVSRRNSSNEPIGIISPPFYYKIRFQLSDLEQQMEWYITVYGNEITNNEDTLSSVGKTL